MKALLCTSKIVPKQRTIVLNELGLKHSDRKLSDFRRKKFQAALQESRLTVKYKQSCCNRISRNLFCILQLVRDDLIKKFSSLFSKL